MAGQRRHGDAHGQAATEVVGVSGLRRPAPGAPAEGTRGLRRPEAHQRRAIAMVEQLTGVSPSRIPDDAEAQGPIAELRKLLGDETKRM
jgi:hypothetical protein